MQEKDFISYEYKTATVKEKDLTKAVDMYEAFGWETTSTTRDALNGVTISLKRDRKINHKRELNKLERQSEEVFDSINGLHRSKTLGASIFSYIFGVFAALVAGGGMSMVMTIENNTAAFVGGIILGILGIALCGINYVLYKKIAEKKTKTLLPVIDQEEEKLANLLEQGNDLLRSELI